MKSNFLKSLIVISVLLGLRVEAKSLVVAVIDTGFDKKLMKSKFLCPSGHKDFTGTGLYDNHGHGTHVSTLIHQYVTDIKLTTDSSNEDIHNLLSSNTNYCQVILKFYDPKDTNSMTSELKAFLYAIDLKVDIINFSGGGQTPSQQEFAIIKKALDAGIKVVVAAGNEGSNIENKPYYPAVIDSRLIVVGNKTALGKIAPTSNFGDKVNAWEVGTDVVSLLPDNRIGLMSGTSQATAIKTGKILKKILEK